MVLPTVAGHSKPPTGIDGGDSNGEQYVTDPVGFDTLAGLASGADWVVAVASLRRFGGA